MDIIKLLDNELLIAILAGCVGCFVRYAETFKQSGIIVIKSFIIDELCAIALSFYAFWYVIDELGMKPINGCLLNIIIGFSGVKAIEIFKTAIPKVFKVLQGVKNDEKN